MKSGIDRESGVLSREHEWFEWLPMPDMEGFKPPSWALGARVEWDMKYDNVPSIYMLTSDDVFDFAQKEGYEYFPETQAYTAFSGDGRAETHYHGPLSQRLLKFHVKYDEVNKEHIHAEREVWATEASQGYAGRHFNIRMKDGRDAILRGPWHGPPIAGYLDVSTVRISSVRGDYLQRPWTQCMANFGLTVEISLAQRIVAYYCGIERWAAVGHRAGRGLIQPVHPEWALPKSFIPLPAKKRMGR